MSQWIWVDEQALIDLHNRQVGTPIANRGYITSALARPLQNAHWSTPDFADLAALYAALCLAHGWTDGNKRAGMMAAELFINANGRSLNTTDADAYQMITSFAWGRMKQDEVADWFRRRIV